MEFLSNKPLLITDTILRDAHQSQAATRMTTADMLPALEMLDSIGYYSLECWGGATFDACMRFLNEDPWERLRTIRQHVKHTKLQMLFRGQNILGYKHYADDVVDAFCRKSIENGIDIIRIFDALNDVRNLEQAIKSTRKYGGEVEATMSYTVSPIHNEDYFVKLAKTLEEMGASAICAIGGDLLRLVHGANGDHDGIGAVIVQMVVHAGALDTPQVGKEHAGKVGVILLQHSRHLPIEIQGFQPPEEKHQEPAGHDLQDIHGTVGTAALLRSGLVDLPHHLTGHSGQGPIKNKITDLFVYLE